MKKLLIPIFIFAVFMLGCVVYHDNQMKKRQEVDQLIQDAHQSLKIVNSNPNNAALGSVEIVDIDSSEFSQVKYKQF
ncbi:hypothetical protein [Acinetobacter sp.]|uniref:hypothetical protein n=1 Tax=Acinetobacter sp. TaxID=472 RepID=UPI00264943E9|nr:hypothetical protein [Acinetobacter sp.]MDN5512200.1 hypothetical protein [Acinetobacter sp.]MDN5526004.1 hypothetical protein [Acinetobacter sp.]